MYTFVFVHAPEQPRTEADLRAYARTLRQTMPALGLDLTADCAALTDCNCGWFLLQPDGTALPSLVSQAVEETHAVIAYGQVEGAPAAAHAVLDAWRRGGAQAVRELEGVFGAVVVDRREGAVTLISDAVGQRSLYYHAGGGVLIVSPHDLGLLSTGDCPARFDLTSAAGIASVEWSPGGQSLLQDAIFCHPAEYVCWRDGRMQRRGLPVLDAEGRIAPEDRQSAAEQLERMVAWMRERARNFVGAAERVQMDLTGGFDSRAVLGLLLSVTEPSQIHAVCNGEPDSRDARIAARVAEHYQVSFDACLPVGFTPEAYLANTDLMAFAMNGATDSKRAIAPPPQFQRRITPHAWGGGGEVYRRSYYQSLVARRPLTRDDAMARLQRRHLTGKLPWQAPELGAAVTERFMRRVDAYAALSPDGYDIMDLYLLYERETVWGAMAQRFNWNNRGLWTPYLSPQLARMGFRMPAPVGDHAIIHEVILRRYMPRAYWMLVNNKCLEPVKRWGQRHPSLRYVDKAVHAVLHRAQPVLGQAPGRSIDEVRADYFADALQGVLREVLLEQGSLTLALFGSEGAERLLREHASRSGNHLATLGNLATVERWRAMATEIARQAASEKKAQPV